MLFCFLYVHPASWIDAAHQNSVPILGTIILEGQSEPILHQLLTGPDGSSHRQPTYQTNPFKYVHRFDPFFADRLASLCSECNFDGYLVNIEIPAISPSLVRLLIDFLKELRAQLKTISEFHQVIWYDSIDNRGYLNYQNKLNAQNKPYFDVVDGIFLNYWWKPDDLVLTRRTAGNRYFWACPFNQSM